MAVQVNGLAEAIAHLEGVQARSRDLTPVLSVAAADTVALIDDAFETSTGPNGTPWDGLADSTLIARARRAAGPARGRRLIGPLRPGQARTKARRGYQARLANAAISLMNGNYKPLVDTGRLRGSINATGDSRALKFGTNVIYAGAMQFGSRPPQHYRPPRPFLPVEGPKGGLRLMEGGTAGPHWARIREMVKAYILTGAIG